MNPNSASNSFRHFAPASRVHFGDRALDALGAELDRHGASRALLVCGPSMARDEAVMARVLEAAGGRLAGVFTCVRAHSPLESVLAATDRLRTDGADAVIALGGGSAVVTARAASILLAEQRDITELCTTISPAGRPVSPKLSRPKLPQFVIPTTPTTAYGKAGSAVLHPELGRLALYDPKTRAQALFIDPALGMTAPAALVRGAALNAFAMAVQGLESAARDPLADALLIHALRLLRPAMVLLDSAADGPALRGELMLAALLCGQGTEHTTGALASVLGHAVGARFHLDNGVVNAVLLPHTVRFNAPATIQRLAGLAALLAPLPPGVQEPADCIAAVLGDLPIPRRLRDLAVAAEALPEIARAAGQDWFLHQNARRVRAPDDLMSILEAAW